MATCTVYYVVMMDTKKELEVMMKALKGRKLSALNAVAKAYDVKIKQITPNCFEINGHRDTVLKAHECMARCYSRRINWVRNKLNANKQ